MTNLPISPVVLPEALKTQENGKIDSALLTSIDTNGGKLYGNAAKAFLALAKAAQKDGIELKATSSADTYRSYIVQEKTFQHRYSRVPRLGQKPKVWEGKRYWLKKGFAGSAVPGTSNHGYGLAIDLVLNNGVFDWLLKHAVEYGFTWEDQSEKWHIRYVLGDALPKALAKKTTAPKPAAPKPAVAKPAAEKPKAPKASKPVKPTK